MSRRRLRREGTEIMDETIELLEDNWDPDYGTGTPNIRTVAVCGVCSALVLNIDKHMEAMHS